MRFNQATFNLLALLVCIERCKAVFFFPKSSTHGVFAAIAVPLSLPHRNVFVSYNFEANYNSPSTWDIPPVFNGLEEDGEFDADGVGRKLEKHGTNCTSVGREDGSEELGSGELGSGEAELVETTLPTSPPRVRSGKSRKTRDLISRSNFYHILVNKFQRTGFSGEACLLRLICEANTSSEIGAVNGVLGSILHIIFSPSSSVNEGLPLAYYQAEHDGLDDNCQHYEAGCEESIFDNISQPLEDIVKLIESNKI